MSQHWGRAQPNLSIDQVFPCRVRSLSFPGMRSQRQILSSISACSQDRLIFWCNTGKDICQPKKLRGFATYADVPMEDVRERFTPYQRLHQEVLQAERMTMIQMRNQGTINDEVLHRLERELDLEEEQLKR